MENSMKLMMISASVLISCTIIALWFTLSNQIEKYSERKQLQIEEYQVREKQNMLQGYDGMTIYGYEVCRYIRKLLDLKLYPKFYVVMLSGKTISVDIQKDYFSVTTPGNEKYIEPVSLYKCKVKLSEDNSSLEDFIISFEETLV